MGEIGGLHVLHAEHRSRCRCRKCSFGRLIPVPAQATAVYEAKPAEIISTEDDLAGGERAGLATASEPCYSLFLTRPRIRWNGRELALESAGDRQRRPFSLQPGDEGTGFQSLLREHSPHSRHCQLLEDTFHLFRGKWHISSDPPFEQGEQGSGQVLSDHWQRD